MNIDAERSDRVHVKLCRWIAVLFQHLLHTGHASVESINILIIWISEHKTTKILLDVKVVAMN